MRFFEGAMRNSAPILFWSAVAILLLTFVYTLAFALNLSGGQGGSVIVSPPPNDTTLWVVISALVSAISAAVWPFFGAAVCHLIEKRLPEVAEK